MVHSRPRAIATPKETPIARLFVQHISRLHVKNRELHSRVPVVSEYPRQASLVKMEASLRQASSSSSFILTSGASSRVSALFSMRELRRVVMIVRALLLLLLIPFRCLHCKGVSKDEKPEKKVRVPAAIVPRKSCSLMTVDQEATSRRAMAIRRVLEDADVDESTVREFSLFTTTRGYTLFSQSWTSVTVKNRGLIVLLHGLNEHSGRYSDFAKQLNANGFKVYGLDWIGHGGSDGLHAYVHSLDEAVDDMKLFLERVLADNPGLPCFCVGHSTGGAIILKAVLDPKIEARVAGVVLTSPAVGVQPSHPIFSVLAPVMSFLMPRYQFSAANKKGVAVSRDPEALIAKYSDALVYTGSIRVRTGYEILRISSYLLENLNRVKVPFLVLHGTADTVTDPEASKMLYEKAAAADKTIELFEGLLHDLLIEPERDSVIKIIIDWLNSRA